jgi:tetratricopeptide (TPR) repeat protein
MSVGQPKARAPLADRFELSEVIGAGGMAEVHRALDRATGAPVAVKVVRGTDEHDRARFAREALVLAGLRHPAIVRYVAHGEARDGALYLAMELLEGEDLAARLRRGPLAVEEAMALGRRTADALAAAHRRGFIHRDLKPQNLFLVACDPRLVTVLDFGIASATSASLRVTAKGDVVGTPGYLAPEQARGTGPLAATVDVFALGCVLYECLAGRPAFQGEHIVALLTKVLFEDPPPLREVLAGVPSWVDALVGQMLAKDPADRPPNGEAVRDVIDRLSRAAEERAAFLADVSTRGLTLEERPFVNLVLVGAPAAGTPALRIEELAPIAGRFGARAERMIDGSLVAVSLSRGDARDRATAAARCALALREALPAAPLAVAAGRAAPGGRAPVGEVVDRAAELLLAQSALSPVAIDDTTAALLPARFIVIRDGGRLHLSGERPLARAARTLFGRPTPFVGRYPELATLREVLDDAIRTPKARIALVTGEPGAGKSRLREELFDGLDAGAPDVLLGEGDPLRASSAYGILADALRRRFRLRDAAPMPEAHAAIGAAVSAEVEPSEAGRVAAFLAELVGYPMPSPPRPVASARRDPALMGAELERALVDYLRAVTRRGAAALILEDLHWADPASLKLCDSAVRALGDQPLFVLGLARSDEGAALPRPFSASEVVRVHLGDLAEPAVAAMVRALAPGAPDMERLAARAAGNPLFVEELLRGAATDGALSPPGSLLAIVEARLSTYDVETRRVLRAASVFGQSFTVASVEALLGSEASDVGAAIEALVDREVLVSRGGDVAFRHRLVRDAAYEMLTAEDRVLGHRLAGIFLEGRPRRDAPLIAHHFQLGEDSERAARWFATGAQEALDGNDLDTALALAECATSAGAEGEVRGGVLRVQGEARSWKGDYAVAKEHTRAALDLLRRGTVSYFMALATYVTVSDKLGARDEVRRVVDALAEASPTGDATVAFVEAMARTAAHLLASGARAQAEKILAIIERHEAEVSDGVALARVAHARAMHALMGGDVVRFLNLETRASSSFGEAGDARSACATEANAGYASLEIGDYERAERLLRGAVVTATSRGLSNTAAFALHNLGLCIALRGDLAEGERLERASLEHARSQGDRRLEAGAQTAIARIALLAGEPERAEGVCREALAGIDDPTPLRSMVLATLAAALLALGRAGDALEEASEAMCILEELGEVEGETFIRLTYAEVLAATGDHTEATVVLRGLLKRLEVRAAAMDDAVLRRGFLERVPENARCLALAVAWRTDPDPGAPGT